MSNQHLNIEHLCNIARRQVADEFKDLNLVFIVHPAGKRNEVLQRSHEQLSAKPYGKAAFEILQRHAANNDSKFAGFLKCDPKGALSYFQKPSYVCLFFINSDQDPDADMARIRIYNLLWQALDIARQTISRRGQLSTQNTQIQDNDGVLLHPQDKMNQARQNMMADIFTAALMELQGHEGEIKRLGAQRAQESVSCLRGNHPQQSPYPIALEATDIVFQDLKTMGRDKPLSLALNMAREVAETLGDDSIKQWWEFASRAQNMAWMGSSAQDVISTSIYTSEDTYVKAAAYIVSEILALEPEMITNLTSYNPFTESEVNAHLHAKRCEQDAKKLAEQCALHEKQDAYEHALRAQCDDLIAGQPLGWAPMACADTMLLMQRDADDPDLTGNSLKNAYLQSAQSVKWGDIEKLLRLIISVKRKKDKLGALDLPPLMAKIEAFAPYAERLDKILKGVKEEDPQAQSLEQLSAHDPSAVLTEDDYLEMPEDIKTDMKKDPAAID